MKQNRSGKANHYIPLIFFLVFAVLIQIIISVSGKTFLLKEITQSAYYSLVVIGLCLLMGYAGQISLGHAGFFAIGGYISAVLTTYNLKPFSEKGFINFLSRIGFLVERKDLYNQDLLTVSPWVAFLCALALTIMIALLIGIPVIKLKGHYLAMATLGFGLIIYTIIQATEILGAHDPIIGVPPFKFLPALEINGRAGFRVANYYIAWAFILIFLILAVNLVYSRIGRALKSIHGNEQAANMLGVNTARYKLYIFILSAVFAAAAGVFLTHYNGSIGPTEAGIMKSVRYVAIVAVGGMANLWGVVLTSLILNFLSLRGIFGIYDDLVFGAILICIMLFAPNGILRFEYIKNFFSFFWKKALRKNP